MAKEHRDDIASAIRVGLEDKFYYEISDICVMCGLCESGSIPV